MNTLVSLNAGFTNSTFALKTKEPLKLQREQSARHGSAIWSQNQFLREAAKSMEELAKRAANEPTKEEAVQNRMLSLGWERR